MILVFTLCVISSYLIGSVCSAILVCKYFNLPDPRGHGSRNPGATNVLRLAGKKYAFIVLITDMLKGCLPVLVAKMLTPDPLVWGYTCLAAVLGHMYPVYFKFQGGKGVATAIGAFLGLNLIVGSVAIGIWLLVANLTHFSSLASIISMLLAPFFSLPMPGSQRSLFPLMLIMMLILFKHRNNITRLTRGEEPKINLRKMKDAIKKDLSEEEND